MTFDPRFTAPAIAIVVAAAGLAPAHASTPPNINGALFETNGTLTRSNCTNPALDGPVLFNSDTRVTRQSGATFTATETVPGGSFVGVYSGSIAPDGAVSGNSSATSASAQSTGSFSGNVDIEAGMLSATNAGTTTFSNGDTCDFSSTITGTLVSGPVAADAIVDTALLTSIELVNATSLATEVRAFTSGLGSRIRDVLAGVGPSARLDRSGLYLGAETGLAAGDLTALGPVGVWGSASRTETENDFAALAYEGSRYSFVGGVDVSPSDRLVIGAALGYETADLDTTFNGGNLDSDGFTVAPYVGFVLDETWSVDASVGYTSLESDQFRTDPSSGARVTSSPDSHRWFGQVNLNGVKYVGRWTLGARAGLLWAKSVQDRFVESDLTAVARSTTKLGELSIGGDVAYQIEARGHGIFEPYAGLSYQYDWSMTEIRLATGPQPSNDDDDFLLSAGVRYFGDDALSGSFEWSRRLGRDDLDEDVYSLTLRMQF